MRNDTFREVKNVQKYCKRLRGTLNLEKGSVFRGLSKLIAMIYQIYEDK